MDCALPSRQPAAARPDLRRRVHGPAALRRRFPARGRPRHPRRQRDDDPARRGQHDRGRRPPDGRDGGPPRRARDLPAGHPARRRRRGRGVGQIPPPRARHALTLGPGDTVGEALSLLPKRAHGAVVVVDDDTGRSAWSPTRTARGSTASPSCTEVMSRDPLTLPVDVDPREGLRAAPGRAPPARPGRRRRGRLVGILTRTGALRATLYTPALDARGRLRVAAAVGINGDVAAQGGRAARGRRRPARASTPRTATRTRCSRRLRAVRALDPGGAGGRGQRRVGRGRAGPRRGRRRHRQGRRRARARCARPG